MPATGVVSQKGQVVIPIQVRRQAGLVAGDRLTMVFDAATREIRMRLPEGIDEMADRFTSWLPDGIAPLTDAGAFYESRTERL